MENHHEKFGDLIGKYNINNVIEFGGAHGYLGKYCLAKNYSKKWKIIEPNPVIEVNEIEVIKDFLIQLNILQTIQIVSFRRMFEHLQNPEITKNIFIN